MIFCNKLTFILLNIGISTKEINDKKKTLVRKRTLLSYPIRFAPRKKIR